MTSTQDITIRRLVADDGLALSQCFQRCYGLSYAVADFYDPAAIRARLEDGTLRSVVAVTSSGAIVGHIGLTIRDPRARTVDAGNSIVDLRYRGQQLIVRLARGIVELCCESRFLGFHHYPTTAHPIMQRFAVESGGIETGIMLDYIPPGTEYHEIEEGPQHDRPAVVVVYQPLEHAPAREVFAPEVLKDLIVVIYARCQLLRTVGHGRCSLLPSVPTRMQSAHDRRRGLLRIDVTQVGEDLRDRVRAAIAGIDVPVCQIDLRMAEPATPTAVEVLREFGFFFSAVLPEYLDGDVLRLQRVASETLPSPELVTDDARQLLAVIETDRSRSHRPRAC